MCDILFTLNTDVTAEQPSSSDAKKAKIKDTVNSSAGMSYLRNCTVYYIAGKVCSLAFDFSTAKIKPITKNL